MLARHLTVAALMSVVVASSGCADEPETVCEMVDPATSGTSCAARFAGSACAISRLNLSKGRIDPEGWAACGSRPPVGERPPRGKRLVLLVAKRRLDRTSGTACRGE